MLATVLVLIEQDLPSRPSEELSMPASSVGAVPVKLTVWSRREGMLLPAAAGRGLAEKTKCLLYAALR